ncbi:nucleotidyltransferase domain-containing protein [Haladaptatus pallidirubidus]|uniref:Polymerase nucleotidyl transferase domain-containing protein n=1 Tax=Haladaptatus pallidirubidus TaxID=1008152 RepID=A0AAV3UNH7_9EURY|nr:nucleotidyltransferase domain-containing protein [Haladaptatus pallidirubidus]
MQTQSGVILDFPFPEERVFRYQAMQDILHHLVNEPHQGFTQKELAEITETDISTISRSVDLLDQLGVVTQDTGRPAQIQIDHDHLQKPDPLLSVSQSEFRKPIEAFLTELQQQVTESDDIETLVGVILFGSVARGTADRSSDIDLLVIIDGNHTYGRRIASQIARSLEEQSFAGDRYEFEVLVETPESATQYGAKLREIFDEGLILHQSEDFRHVRAAVYADESEEI